MRPNPTPDQTIGHEPGCTANEGMEPDGSCPICAGFIFDGNAYDQAFAYAKLSGKGWDETAALLVTESGLPEAEVKAGWADGLPEHAASKLAAIKTRPLKLNRDGREAVARLLASYRRLASLAGVTTCACDPDDYKADGLAEQPDDETHRCDDSAADYIEALLQGRPLPALAALPEPIQDDADEDGPAA